MRRPVCEKSGVNFGNAVEIQETMLLKGLREEVLEANLELLRRGLVLYTFGNASGADREQGLVVIKPSGVGYMS
jgi:ribulose-5-phosphate 4-epimerase/fuculose-1-phosphate aldolase